jgi:hypothetical protein
MIAHTAEYGTNRSVSALQVSCHNGRVSTSKVYRVLALSGVIGGRKYTIGAGVIDHFRAHVTLEDLHPREAYGRQAPEENDDNVQNTCERLAYLDNEHAEAPKAIHQPKQPQKPN